jgi:hypothetical protein
VKASDCTRRDFFGLSAAGLAPLQDPSRTQPSRGPRPGIPGLYRGEVVGVAHSGSVAYGSYQDGPIQQMVRRGLTELTGLNDYVEAWRVFVQPGDRVGIKVNPNGNELMISSRAFFLEIIDGLVKAGIPLRDIIVYERHKEILDRVANWFPAEAGLMWADPGWDEVQQDPAGYDLTHFVEHYALLPGQQPSDKARRSYAAEFLTQHVDKVINCATLKTHQAAGVTLSLKNLSHGMVNNVSRSHPEAGFNYLRDFIPTVVSMPIIRAKTVLNIIDGVHGLYHGGPNGAYGFVWEHKTIYFATDPVALDKIGWRTIDQKRASLGLPPVVDAPYEPPYFNFSQVRPDHIDVAGAMGLGEWREDRIHFRLTRLA